MHVSFHSWTCLLQWRTFLRQIQISRVEIRVQFVTMSVQKIWVVFNWGNKHGDNIKHLLKNLQSSCLIGTELVLPSKSWLYSRESLFKAGDCLIRIWSLTQISSCADWQKLSLYKFTGNSKCHVDFIPAWPSYFTEQVNHLAFQMYFPFYILKILFTHL